MSHNSDLIILIAKRILKFFCSSHDDKDADIVTLITHCAHSP